MTSCFVETQSKTNRIYLEATCSLQFTKSTEIKDVCEMHSAEYLRNIQHVFFLHLLLMDKKDSNSVTENWFVCKNTIDNGGNTLVQSG